MEVADAAGGEGELSFCRVEAFWFEEGEKVTADRRPPADTVRLINSCNFSCL